MSQNNNRVFYRIPTDMIAQIDVPDGADEEDLYAFGVITNLSEGGAFLETINRFQMGTDLKLTFQLPDDAGSFVMHATVCRLSDEGEGGIGLRFTGLETDNQLTLSRLVDEERTRESSPEESDKDVEYCVGDEGDIEKRVVEEDGSETVYHRNSSGEFVPVVTDDDQAFIAAKLLRLIESGDADAIENMGFKVERPKTE